MAAADDARDWPTTTGTIRRPSGAVATALAVLVALLVVALLHAVTQRVALLGSDSVELGAATRLHDAALRPPSQAGTPTRLPYLQLPGACASRPGPASPPGSRRCRELAATTADQCCARSFA